MVLENTLITTHVNVSVKTLHRANVHGITTQTHASVPVNLMVVTQVNTLTMTVVAVSVTNISLALITNISMEHLASVSAMRSRNVVLENSLIMIHVNASVEILHHANVHGIMTQTHASVPVNLMIVTKASTLTMTVAVASVRSTRRVQPISTSTK